MNQNELNALRDSLLAEIKQMMLTTGQVTQYIGARYVPVFANPIEWDEEREYEPLTVVQYQGDSYTSRQFVPKGIRIADAHYWAITGNYNAQIEQYRQEVQAFDQRITNAQNTANAKAPIGHASMDDTYGLGNAALYGHVKLTDELTPADSNDGLAATPKMVYDMQDKLNTGTDTNLIRQEEQTKTSRLSSVEITSFENYYNNGTRAVYTDSKVMGTGTQEEIDAFGITRDDASTLLPDLSGFQFTQSGDPTGAICAAATFLNRGIVYGRTNEIFNKNVDKAEQMVCSDYSWLAMMGACYNTTKFTAPYNAMTQYKAEMPVNTDSKIKVDHECWITREQAAAFAASGKLFEVKSIKQIMPGDILFNTSPETPEYLGITHCAIVVDVYPELSLCSVLQCGATNYNLVKNLTNNSDTSDSSMNPNYAIVNPFKFDNVKHYVGRPNWNNVKPRKIATFSGTENAAITSSTEIKFRVTTGKDLPLGAMVDVKMYGDFHKLHSTSRMNTLSIGVITPGKSSGATRIARYYATNENHSKYPCFLQLRGFLNNQLGASDEIGVAIGASNPATFSIDYTIDVYVP